MPIFVPVPQLKILVLLCLKSAHAPLPLTTLTDIPASCDINALSVQLCVNELLDQGHIVLVGDYVKISETGEIIINELENTAPASLRKRIIAATTVKLTELRRELGVGAEITEAKDNFRVRLTLRDGEEEIFNFSFLCPTKAQAETCVRTFKEQPSDIFRKFLGALVKEDI